MLFKKLFIATLAALALVGCNDDNDIDNPALTEAGDVNVVFATSSSEQAVTKSDVERENVYPNFTSTDEVYEYCLKKKVDDPEFVIDHMTVFVFDEKGGLVKTAYFEDVLDAMKGTSMNLPGTEVGANSICEFGGIVLKAGTYNFILAGNLTKAQINAKTETFEEYKKAAITWEDKDKKKCISSQIANTYLPMVKVLNGVKLVAHKRTANATLNFIYEADNKSNVQAPENSTDESPLSVSSPIQLTRLVARIQLKSLKFNWTVKGDGGETPAASITLKKVYLANASNKSVLTGDNEGDGYIHGFEYKDGMFFQLGAKDELLVKDSDLDESIINGGKKHEWTNAANTDNPTALLPLSFYAFGKTISEKNEENLTMVLECSAAYAGESVPAASVFYYVPIVNGAISSIAANNVYNVNVTLIGQGSDENGKKYDKPTVKFEWTFEKWNKPQKIEIGGTPVPNN